MLLAIDTSTKTLGIALFDGAEIRAECVWHAQGHHTRSLAPEIGLMLRRTGVSRSDLQALGIALGPGSFTGLRIGLAFAKGLAANGGLPMAGIPTLDILAAAQPKMKSPLFAAIEAGRGRIAGGWYRWSRGRWKASGVPTTTNWEQVIAEIDGPAFLCGDLTSEARRLAGGREGLLLAAPSSCVRRPAVLAELAWEKVQRGKADTAARLAPIYLKPPAGAES